MYNYTAGKSLIADGSAQRRNHEPGGLAGGGGPADDLSRAQGRLMASGTRSC